MCGIAGIYHRSGISQGEIDVVTKMNGALKHRGPDDEGLFFDRFCVLGHRRLSIIDLSNDGHQPFHSDDNRHHLIFNGEIYNYIELRQELCKSGWKFKTKTDTEVLLKAYLEYGKDCLGKFNGMFAFAIYDSESHSFFMARDRVGVKPLYYCIQDSKLYFASEIKALKMIPSLRFTLDYQTLFDYLCFSRTDIFEETFVNEIKRLPKGHFAYFSSEGLDIKQWWDPERYCNSNSEDKRGEKEICRNIENLFLSSVDLRMRSDVPVGSSLSGGLDSSVLVGAIFHQHKLKNDFKTFTASFPNTILDETSYVDKLNKRYPFKNYRTYPSADTALHNLSNFVYANDEPTASPSFYAQYEVMRLAKENGITVLLDGQGGDESFAGYHYFHGFFLYGLLKSKRLMRFSGELYKNIARRQDALVYKTLLFQLLPGPLKKSILLRSLPHISKDFFYAFIDSSKIFNNFFDADNLNKSLVRHFQYKLEHLLRMEDRNSMAFSIEARVPYLDYRIIEYVLGIQEDFKIKLGETKYLQKLALGKYTVPEILNRKDKFGFETPVEAWMKTPVWENLTINSYNELQTFIPAVYTKDSSLPRKGYERWKINQLAAWKKVILN